MLTAKGRVCEVWKKERDYQTKTYSKYHSSRNEKDGRDCKICGSDQKKYPNNQKTKLSYVWNKCNHKTRGGCPACKQNESSDPGDENRHGSSYWKTLQRPKHQSCNKPWETSKARQEELDPSLLSWVLSLGHYRPHPKGKLKGPPSPTNKNYSKKGQILVHGNGSFHLPNWENTGEHQNEKAGSTFKMPSRTKPPIWINKHCNALGSTKPLQRTYSIESMDSNTDHIVASLNLEEVLNNYNTWNYLTVGQLIS